MSRRASFLHHIALGLVCFQALIPPGAMPGDLHDGWHLQLCPDAMGLSQNGAHQQILSAISDAHSHHAIGHGVGDDEHHERTSIECPFAAFSQDFSQRASVDEPTTIAFSTPIRPTIPQVARSRIYRILPRGPPTHS